VDGLGEIYVTDNETGLIKEFDGAGANLINQWDATQGTGLESAEFVAVNGNCSGGITQVLVTDGYGSVGAFGITGAMSVSVLGSIQVSDSDLSDTEGLAIGPNSWVMADWGNDRIDQYGLCTWMCQTSHPTPSSTYTPSFISSVTVTLTPTPLPVCSSSVVWGTVSQPWGVALNGSGNVCVSSIGGAHTVNVLNPITGQLTSPIQYGQGQYTAGPMGVAVDGNGYVYVTNEYQNMVFAFSPSGQPITQWGAPGRIAGEFEEPEGISAYTGSSGTTVYVADQDNQRIQAFTAGGGFITQWGVPGAVGNGTFNSPQGVAVDGVGNVYVADNETGLVQEFTGQGVLLNQWDAT
jgi:DNA-binding beta-propeller fold protein YncE